MEKKLTLWQRAVLAIMYSFERDALANLKASDAHVHVEFTRRALEELLLFDWQAYHTVTMLELENLGWIVFRYRRGVTYCYVLTDAASVNLWQNHLVAAGYTQALTNDHLKMPF